MEETDKKKHIKERNELINLIYHTPVSSYDNRTKEELVADLVLASGYHKQSEWISVKDKFPEKDAYVLCYFKYEPESPNVICENRYHGSGFWMSEGSKVTHWMPLPAAPRN